jgi:hypothetical protein
MTAEQSSWDLIGRWIIRRVSLNVPPSPGVDVMNTMFAYFSAKKMAFFSKFNVMLKFLQKLAVV